MNALHYYWSMLLPSERAVLQSDIQNVGAERLHELINRMSNDHVRKLASRLGITVTENVGVLRLALWQHGAKLEGRSDFELPRVVSSRLRFEPIGSGMHPASLSWPRPVPAVAFATNASVETPRSLDELLARADELIGVDLGSRGADKGAWGQRAAQRLGLHQNSDEEPDFAGECEVKTVPAMFVDGAWSIAEDPAICLVGVDPLRKLRRTLWLVRITLPPAKHSDDPERATILSWYQEDMNASLRLLLREHLHVRPKGPKARTSRGIYLARAYFAASGLLASLNGPPHIATSRSSGSSCEAT